MTLLLAHFSLLTLLAYGAARRLVANPADRIIATALLFWGNIVTLGLGLSLLGRLNEAAWFFRGSLLLGAATFLLVRRGARPDADPRPAPAEENRSVLLLLAVCGTLAPILLANLIIAATYEPSNYDSLTYHLPRVLYYLGQGSLANFETADFRQVLYPFNFNLLQLLCLVYGAPVQTVNFPNVAAWVVTGLAVFRLSRLAGGSFNAALIAAWLTLTSTEVLAQATSTILDLPTGAALLCALVFALRWRDSGRGSDALLAGLAAAMGAGTKLTAAFFGPPAALLLVVLWYQAWRRGEAGAFLRGGLTWIGPGLLAGVLCAPFVLYNLQATGHMMTDQMDFTLNKPFTLGCAAQTAKAYLVQIFCEPLGRFTFDLDQINALNQWFSHNVFAHWNPAYAFSPLYTIPPDVNEDHVFFGFAGPLFLLCALLCLWRDRRLERPMGWIALLGLGWFAFYFATNKWSLYNQRYFVPPLVVLGPCVAAVWDAGGNRFKRLLFLAVAATGLWFAVFYLLHNTIRPVPFAHVSRPQSLPALPPFMVERLAAQSRINVSSYGTNERIFPLLHLGTHQRITSGSAIDPGRYTLFSFWGHTRNYIYSNLAYYASYTTVPVADKRTAGLEFLGTVLGGADIFDYFGLAPHADAARATPQNSQIGVIVEYSANTNDPVRLGAGRIRVIGLNPGDAARAEITAEMPDGTSQPLLVAAHSDWTGVAVKKTIKRLVIRVVADADGRVLGQGEIPFTVRRSDVETDTAPSPAALFSTELITGEPVRHLGLSGLGGLEGPYPQWDLPRFRWAKQPAVRITIPADAKLKQVRLTFSARLQVRDAAILDVRHNGKLVQSFRLSGRASWSTHVVTVPAAPGDNVFDLQDRSNDEAPDWLAYLEQNPDVKQYVIDQKQPLEEGARLHYQQHGRAEGRPLPVPAGSAPPDSLYYAYRTLRVEGLVTPP